MDREVDERQVRGETREEESPRSPEERERLGDTPRAGGQRWTAILVHAAFPALAFLGILSGLLGPVPSWETVLNGAAGWPLLATIIALGVWFFARAYRQVRFHAAQAFLWTLVINILAGILFTGISPHLVWNLVGMLPVATGAVVGGVAAWMLYQGRSFRYPGAGFLVAARMRS